MYTEVPLNTAFQELFMLLYLTIQNIRKMSTLSQIRSLSTCLEEGTITSDAADNHFQTVSVNYEVFIIIQL